MEEVKYNGEDVTPKIDVDVLAEVLSGVNCRQMIKTFAPYQRTNVVWEINFRYKNSSMHILLGKFNVCYESVDKGADEIQNPEMVNQALLKMVTK